MRQNQFDRQPPINVKIVAPGAMVQHWFQIDGRILHENHNGKAQNNK